MSNKYLEILQDLNEQKRPFWEEFPIFSVGAAYILTELQARFDLGLDGSFEDTCDVTDWLYLEAPIRALLSYCTLDAVNEPGDGIAPLYQVQLTDNSNGSERTVAIVNFNLERIQGTGAFEERRAITPLMFPQSKAQFAVMTTYMPHPSMSVNVAKIERDVQICDGQGNMHEFGRNESEWANSRYGWSDGESLPRIPYDEELLLLSTPLVFLGAPDEQLRVWLSQQNCKA